MNKWGSLAVLIFLLFQLQQAYAATVYGNIYDISLNKVDNVRIEINTIPKQHYVAKNGSYSFNVPLGDYSIKAAHYSGNTFEISSENVSVKDTGNYVLDLVLFPSFEEEKELLKETGVNIANSPKSTRWYLWFFAGSLLLASSVMVIFILFRKQKPKKIHTIKEEGKSVDYSKEPEIIKHPVQEHYDVNEVLRIIKDEGGRTTQKEIRKRIPLSEAKISLMVSELEAKGAIKKIKKGRGNIIIMNK